MTQFHDKLKDKNVLDTRDNKVFIREGDAFIKVFDESFPLSDILNEALNQTRAMEAGLPVPKIHQVAKYEGYWAIYQDFIEGKTLSSLMKEAKTDDEKAELLERFLSIQLNIFDHQAPLLNDLRAKMNRQISESEYNATVRYELHSRLSTMPKHKKICHGDLIPANIIITDEDEAYIIDWSHATSGNASADAALTYMLFMLQGEEQIAETYLKLFCEKTDTARQYVNAWMPIVACAQSTKKKEEEKAFLDRWVNVMEFQ